MVMSRLPVLSDRQGFDRRWYAPSLKRVYAPASAAEVTAAWREVIASGAKAGELQITCGRHCYENFVYNAGTKYIIDLTGLCGVGSDPNYGYYIDVGFGNWDMYRMLNNMFDTTLPAGSCYSVGLGGHITGGGYGLFSRAFGLTVDYLSAVDVVIMPQGAPTPELYEKVSPVNHPDLFWAICGGGGGNFGIITRYYFQDTPKAPQYLYTTAFSFDWQDENGNLLITEPVLKQLLDNFTQFSQEGQDGDKSKWPSFGIFHANHLAAGKMVFASYYFDAPSLGVQGQEYEAYLNDRIKDQKKTLGEITRLSTEPGPINGHPWHGTAKAISPVSATAQLRRFTFLEGVQNTNGSGPNQFGKYKSAYMKKGFTDDMVAALHEHLQKVPDGVSLSDMSQSLCQIDSYGCAINQVSSTTTPIAQRSSIMKLQYQTYWDNDAAIGQDNKQLEKAHVGWINEMYTDVYAKYGGFPDPRSDPDDIVDGCYFNYPDSCLGVNGENSPGIDHAMYLYFLENYDTGPADRNLRAIKSNWNPQNWFASAQSIPVK
ncbi:FAD binding domain protein [Pseudovibrio sp. Ad13]|uniref:FAD-binding protein n=1 Tax=Pseudovibrio sp. Ad13 TaxID=989396 RepID=UPI0007AEC610|nr:FAD-binding protein [Pseudovibrio sp. Ad13]KZK85213.1 FAD binding domain protein [Pseudovibrio sp. Ad13]